MKITYLFTAAVSLVFFIAMGCVVISSQWDSEYKHNGLSFFEILLDTLGRNDGND